MRERSGRQDVPERSGPNGLARRASAANATNESGGEAEIAGGGWGAVWGRDAEFTERSRGGSQRRAAIDWLANGGDSRMFDHLELSDRFPDLQAMDSRAFCSCPGIRGFVDRVSPRAAFWWSSGERVVTGVVAADSQ